MCSQFHFIWMPFPSPNCEVPSRLKIDSVSSSQSCSVIPTVRTVARHSCDRIVVTKVDLRVYLAVIPFDVLPSGGLDYPHPFFLSFF